MDITPSSHHTPSQSAGLRNPFAGIQAHFPTFRHDHPPVMDVNKIADEQLRMGEKIADNVVATMGSWRFIISQALIMVIWITLNLVGWFYHWDLYPFVLLNLVMSAQAAFATPLIMMSQNRQASKDRLTADNDYKTDVKGEIEICNIMEHLDHQDKLILQLIEHAEAQHQQIILLLNKMDPEMAGSLHSAQDALTGEDAD